MPRDSKVNSEPFPIDGLRQLLELMEKHDVREFRWNQGEARCVLRRGPQELAAGTPMFLPAPAPLAAPVPAGSPAVSAPAGSAAPVAAAPTEEQGLTIKSPTVGTFYPAPAPGDPAFVKPGETVKPETIVCIVEAMKVFNQIPAGVSGTIVKALVSDGDAVEYGQPLFLVKPN